MDQFVREQVLRLLEQGQKIEAVKLYKDSVGVGLKEAKDAVEALQRNESAREPIAHDAALQGELLHLLQQGSRLEAIKLYKDRQGVSLANAKAVIDELGDRHGLSQSTGCGLVGALVLAAGATIWALL